MISLGFGLGFSDCLRVRDRVSYYSSCTQYVSTISSNKTYVHEPGIYQSARSKHHTKLDKIVVIEVFFDPTALAFIFYVSNIFASFSLFL